MKSLLSGLTAALLLVLVAGLAPRPAPRLSSVVIDAMNLSPAPAGLFTPSIDEGNGAQKFGLGNFSFDLGGNGFDTTYGGFDSFYDPSIYRKYFNPEGTYNYNIVFPELNGPAAGQTVPEIVQTANRLGITPEALAFNRTISSHFADRADGLEGERDAVGNFLYDGAPVTDNVLEGLIYIQEGTAVQFEKQSQQLQAIQNLSDSERLSMAKGLLGDAEVVQDAYINMIANEPLNYDRSGRRVSRQAEYNDLMAQADQAQQAGNTAEATRLHDEAQSTAYGTWLWRRGEFFSLLNENPLLGIYGDPSWAPFNEGYFFQNLYWEFYTNRTSPSMMTSDELKQRDVDLLAMFDTYIQIGIDNANETATEIRSYNTVEDLVQFGGPKYGSVQDLLISNGYALGSERPWEYVNSARGFYDEVDADNATSDMAWTIFFVTAAAASSIFVPGSGGLILTATITVGELGYETIKLVNIEMEESQMMDMAPVLGFEQLGPIQDENSDQWGAVFMAGGFGIFDLTALRQFGAFARRTDDMVDVGRALDAATTTKRWGHLGTATVDEAFGHPGLADDAWVHFGPSSMEDGVRQSGVVGYGNRSYWMRWGEVKDMTQGQLRFAIGEMSASGTSDLKLMVVAPDGANIRRINGNYGLRDEGVIEGAVEGGTFHRAVDEVDVTGGVATPVPTKGLEIDDAALFSGRLDEDEFEILDDAVAEARDAGVPDADIEYSLDYMRRRMEQDPSFDPTAATFKQLTQVRYAETHGYVIILDRGRSGKLEMEEDLLRYTDGIEPGNVRVIGFTQRPMVQELLARAQAQEMGAHLFYDWSRLEAVAEDILRHTDEDLAKWLAFDRTEGGLYRIFKQEDIDNLRRIFPEYTPDGRGLEDGLESLDEYNDFLEGYRPDLQIPRGRSPGTLPPAPGQASNAPAFDLGDDALMFGGTAGLGAAGLSVFDPSQAGDSDAQPEFAMDVYITSNGGSTGPVMQISILNHGKPAKIEGSGVILEPVELDPEQLQQLQDGLNGLGGDNFFTATMDAYCLEQEAGVPEEGTVYRIAEPQVQALYAPMGLIIGAAPTVKDQLNPDSDPDDYYHSIVQWAVWTHEKGLDQVGFENAFLEHTKENVAAAGQEWQPEWDDQVRSVVPNRWRDIGIVLDAAGFSY